MAGLLFLCTAVALAGYLAGRAALPFFMQLPCPRAERLSYGGVLRACPQSGGLVLTVAAAGGLAPLVWIGSTGPGLMVLLPLLAGLGFAADAAQPTIPDAVWPAVCIVLFVLCPEGALPGAVLIAFIVTVANAQIERADRVAGVPAALHAPALAGGSAFLIVAHGATNAFAGLAAAGGLLAIHAFHRFPPRIAFGRSGSFVLTCLTVLFAGQLAMHGEWFAIALLWSFPLADLVYAALHPFAPEPHDAFDRARQRGEPEAGLTLATGSLACANVILLLTLSASSPALQAAAAALSLFLAFRFRAFLDGAPARRPLRPPWHVEK